MQIFLHGGGDHPDWRAATFGRFAAACGGRDGIIGLVLVDADDTAALAAIAEYRAIFTALGVPDERLVAIVLCADSVLTPEHVPANLAGLYVCGGATPLYHRALCTDLRWLEMLRERRIPYGGTSSGAMIAAQHAIIGGWHVERLGRNRQFVFPGAGEGLAMLTVQSGLGLTPFAVDVHAGQMGTLARLIHTVELGLVPAGWALDEDTQLELDAVGVQVVGRGNAYHVQASDAGVTVRIVNAD